MDEVTPPDPDVFVLDPTHPPAGEVREDAPTTGGLLWIVKFHEDQPAAFPLYFQVVLGRGCKAADDERAARNWSPLCYQMTGYRLLAGQWKAFRHSQGWKDHRRGPTRRRYGVPIEVVESLPDQARGRPGGRLRWFTCAPGAARSRSSSAGRSSPTSCTTWRSKASYPWRRRATMSEVEETPDMMYGRLLEAAHLSSYTFERVCTDLEWLLTDDRWKQLGSSYRDINSFLRLLDFSALNLENRPELVRRINELQPEASNRAIAEAIGVDERTVRRDTTTAAEAADVHEVISVPADLAEPPVAHAAPAPNPMADPEVMADGVATNVAAESEADEPERDDEDADDENEVLLTGEDEDEAEVIDEGEEAPVAPEADQLARWREAYPEFVHPGIPADDFRLIAEKLDAMSEEQRLEYRQRWRRRDQNALSELLDEPPIPEPDPQEVSVRKAREGWENFLLQLSVLACSVQDGWADLMEARPEDHKRSALNTLLQWHARLGAWITEIEGSLKDGTSGDDLAPGQGDGDRGGAEAREDRQRGDRDRPRGRGAGPERRL
jgi:hypothetical protein